MISSNMNNDLTNSSEFQKFEEKCYGILNVKKTTDKYKKNKKHFTALDTEFKRIYRILLSKNEGSNDELKVVHQNAKNILNILLKSKTITKDSIDNWNKFVGIENRLLEAEVSRIENIPFDDSEYLRREAENVYLNLSCSNMNKWNNKLYIELQIKLDNVLRLLKIYHASKKIQVALNQPGENNKKSEDYEYAIKVIYDNMKPEFANPSYFGNSNAYDVTKNARKILLDHQDRLLSDPKELNKALSDNPLKYSAEVKEALIKKFDNYQLIFDSELSEKHLANLFSLDEKKAEHFVKAHLNQSGSVHFFKEDIHELLVAMSSVTAPSSDHASSLNYLSLTTILKNYTNSYNEKTNNFAIKHLDDVPVDMKHLIIKWVGKYFPKAEKNRAIFIDQLSMGVSQLQIIFNERQGVIDENLDTYATPLGVVHMALSGNSETESSNLSTMTVATLKQQVPSKYILFSALIAPSILDKNIKEIADSLSNADLVKASEVLIKSSEGRAKLALIFKEIGAVRVLELVKRLDEKTKRFCLNQCIMQKLTDQAPVGTKEDLAVLALEEYVKEVSEIKSSLPDTIHQDHTSMISGLFSRDAFSRQAMLADDKALPLIQKLSMLKVEEINQHNANCYGNMLLTLLWYPQNTSFLTAEQLMKITSLVSTLAKSKKWLNANANPTFYEEAMKKLNKLTSNIPEQKKSAPLKETMPFQEVVAHNTFITLNEPNPVKAIYADKNRNEIIHKLISNFDKSASSLLGFLENNPYLKVSKNPILGWQFTNMILDAYTPEEINQLHERTRNILLENVGSESQINAQQRSKLVESFSTEKLAQIIHKTQNVLLLEDLLGNSVHRNALFNNGDMLFDIAATQCQLSGYLNALQRNSVAASWLRVCMLMRANLVKELADKKLLMEQVNLVAMNLDTSILIRVFKSVYAINPDCGRMLLLRILKSNKSAELRKYRKEWQDAIQVMKEEDRRKIALNSNDAASLYFVYLLLCNEEATNKIISDSTLFKTYLDLYLSKPIASFKSQDIEQLDPRVQYHIFLNTDFILTHSELTIEQMITFGSNLTDKQWAEIISTYLTKMVYHNAHAPSSALQIMLFNKLDKIAPSLNFEQWGNILTPLAALKISGGCRIPENLSIRIASQCDAFKQLKKLDCVNDFFDTNKLLKMSNEEIKQMDGQVRRTFFENNSPLLNFLKTATTPPNLQFVKALTHEFKSSDIKSIIEQYHDNESSEQKKNTSINMTAISILFGVDPYEIVKNVSKIDPVYSKQIAFHLLEELCTGMWASEEKRVNDCFHKRKGFLESNLSDSLVSACLSHKVTGIDHERLTNAKNKYFVNYVEKNWSQIVKNNDLATLEAFLKNPQILSKLSKEQLTFMVSELKAKECTPEQYKNLIVLLNNHEISRKILLANIPTYLENMKDDQFSYFAKGAITELIQKHCAYIESENQSTAIDAASNWYKRLDREKSPRKCASIVNAVYADIKMKEQLISNKSQCYSQLIREKIQITTAPNLRIELYSITDEAARIKFAFHIFNNILKSKYQKYKDIISIVKPIVELSKQAWYSFFTNWYYAIKEKLNRRIYETNIKEERAEGKTSTNSATMGNESYSKIHGSLNSNSATPKNARNPASMNHKNETLPTFSQRRYSFYNAANALNEKANADQAQSRGEGKRMGQGR